LIVSEPEQFGRSATGFFGLAGAYEKVGFLDHAAEILFV
jgi:hypothetical protein